MNLIIFICSEASKWDFFSISTSNCSSWLWRATFPAHSCMFLILFACWPPSLHLQQFVLIWHTAVQGYWLIISALHGTVGLHIKIIVFIIIKTSAFNLICAHKWLFCSLECVIYLCTRAWNENMSRTKWGMKFEEDRMGM